MLSACEKSSAWRAAATLTQSMARTSVQSDSWQALIEVLSYVELKEALFFVFFRLDVYVMLRGCHCLQRGSVVQ